jgi:tetratricopeptide (TPR) repeat protein
MLDDADVQVKLARLWLLVGQFDEARQVAERYLLRHPNHLPALVARANALAGLQNVGDAIEQIEEAIQLDPAQSQLYSNLGSLQARSGRLSEAATAFKQAVTVEPASADARTALANFYMATGEPKLAEQELHEAVRLDPKALLAHRALAQLYLVTGRPADAGPHLKAIAELAKSPTSKVQLADFYLMSGKRDDGIKLLESMTLETGGYWAARTRLAALAYSEGRREEAHKIVEEILSKGRYAQAILLKAKFLETEGKYPEALVEVRNALEVSPNLLAAHYMNGELYQRTGEWARAQQSYEHVLELNPRAGIAQAQLAKLELKQGRVDLSLEYAERAVRNAPADVAARVTLVRILVQQGNVRRAESELAVLARQFPDAAQVHTLRGNVLMLRRDFVPARRSYEEALRKSPESFDALAGLVGLDVVTGRHAEARARAIAALERAPKDVERLLLAAQTFAATGDIKKTEEYLKTAIATNPGRPEPYAVLAQFYVQQSRLEEGKQTFEKLIEIDPRSVGAHTMIAVILRKQNRIDDAVQQYLKTLSIDPQAAVAANNLAWIYADQGHSLEEGLQLARIARSKMPSQPEVIDTIGWLYYKLRSPQLALPYIKEAIERDPRNPQYRYHLAAVHARAGDTDLARAAIAEAFKLGNDFYGAEDARRLRERLLR